MALVMHLPLHGPVDPPISLPIFSSGASVALTWKRLLILRRLSALEVPLLHSYLITSTAIANLLRSARWLSTLWEVFHHDVA